MRSQEDWNAIGQKWLAQQPQRLWRHLHNELNQPLLARWSSLSPQDRVLKTDLFDEAVGNGLLSSIEPDTSVFGMDYALTVAARARRPGRAVLTCDARQLPFEDACFDLVVSNSTLDHFEHHDELRRSLGEFRRVLRPGGRMILTMDNLANPVLALRNRLPFRLLQAMGIIPYPMGRSGGPTELNRLVEDAGFRVLETRGLSHVPRLPAVVVSRWLGRWTGEVPPRWFRHIVLAWERLESLPTRYRTAYYVAMLLEPGEHGLREQQSHQEPVR